MSQQLVDQAITTAGGRGIWSALRGLKIRVSIAGHPDNTVNLNLPSITLDIHDVEFIRSGEKQTQP